jgi:perosamine synthetase
LAILDGTAIEHPELEYHLAAFNRDAADRTWALRPGRSGNVDQLTPLIGADGKLVDVLVDRSKDFVQVARPNLSHHEFRALIDAFLSSWISGKGPHLRDFEREFAAWVGTKHGIAVANGTVALHLALSTLGIGPGHEVIVPDLTFAATINAVLYCGATPVIVDVDRRSWTMSAAQVQAALTPRTKAIIPVHLYGRPAEIGPIADLAKAHNCFVIEDCAEAHGARYAGRRIGSFSDIACFSFHSNKIVATGEGGMCLVDSDSLAARAIMLRDHGMVAGRIYWHEEIGYNYRMPNLQAALGLAQLSRAEETIQRNLELERAYHEHLAGISGLVFPPSLGDEYEPIVWLVSVQVPAEKRAALIEAAQSAGIELRPFFHALSTMPLSRQFAKTCHNSLELSATGLNLPTSTVVDASVMEKIAGIFRSVLR